jgi:hypothetical protein
MNVLLLLRLDVPQQGEPNLQWRSQSARDEHLSQRAARAEKLAAQALDKLRQVERNVRRHRKELVHFLHRVVAHKRVKDFGSEQRHCFGS